MATDPALQQANQALAPILAELARQKQQEQTRAANQQATATASASGLSDVLGGIAPQIQGDYQKAADSAFEYGRQLGLQYASGSNQDAGGLNEFLAKQGSPGSVKAAGDAGGTVLAGLGGLIPASGLQREGAAFTAAARNLPATALGRGQEQSAAIGRESLDRLSQLDALVRGEKTKLPGLVSDFRSKAAEDKRAQEALEIQKWYLKNTMRQTGAAITGIDPATGLPTYETTEEVAQAAADKKDKRAKAVAKRNEATTNAFIDAGDWVEEQLKPGTQLVPKAQQPIIVRTQKVGKETVTIYAKKGGGETRKASEAETKTVYDQQLIPPKQYDTLHKQLVKRFRAQLGRYGYKQKQLVQMADDLLSDYFAVVGGQAPNPTVPDKTGPPPNKR